MLNISNRPINILDNNEINPSIIAKRPKLSFSNKETIYFYDYNPAHAIWWILEQLSDLPTSLDETSFKAAAATLYDEGFGINILLRN